MKYFYDTEFIEDGKTIELVSIGIIDECDRTYYAISNEFDPTKADEWVKHNVLRQLSKDPLLWKSRDQIRNDIIDFVGKDKPEWWAYYSAYDHVVLCQIFGRMIDLPKGWPFYTNDIKQLCKHLGNPLLPEQVGREHDALEDARWNKAAYEFLNNKKPVNESY